MLPPRQPIADTFTGAVIETSGVQLLGTSNLLNSHAVVQGLLTVRYGIRYLGKPHISIVPALVVLDYGEILTGEPAWDFLLNKSNRFPRAEVFGYRNDGVDDSMLVKWLDLSIPPQVLVYATPDATTPVAQPTRLIAADKATLPARLLQYLNSP